MCFVLNMNNAINVSVVFPSAARPGVFSYNQFLVWKYSKAITFTGIPSYHSDRSLTVQVTKKYP